MIYVVLFFIAGIFFGYLVRKKDFLIRVSDNISIISVNLLLFILGFGVGINKNIINNFSKIGLNAFIITFGAILGSLISTAILYKYLFKEIKNET